MKRTAIALALLLASTAALGQQSSPDWVKIPHKWSVAEMQDAQHLLSGGVQPTQTSGPMPTAHASVYDAVRPQFNGRRLPADASLSAIGSWTPPAYETTVHASGWVEFSDTDQYRMWVAYRQPDPNQGRVQFALKVATKGINGGATGITVVGGGIVCGSDGAAPNYISMATLEQFAENHNPMAFEGPESSMPLTPGTNLAVAVQGVCKHLASSLH